MKNSLSLGTLAAATMISGMALAADGDTLAAIKARGTMICGTNPGLAGFAARDANDNYQGFDAALCKAIGAAVLGDASKVTFAPLTGEKRFDALTTGQVDVLIRNATWTFTQDTALAFDAPVVNYYDGQGFIVKKDLGVSSAKELDGATVCVQADAATAANLADFFKVNNMTYKPVAVADDAEGQREYLAGTCDTYTANASGLAAARATMADPENHIILPDFIAKEPLGPLVRHGDNNWGDIVRWTYYALVTAEEKGITAANINEVAATTQDPDVRRLLGLEGDLGPMMGLDNEFAKRAIMAGGNYGEIFEANIGAATPIGLARGLNALWTQGGLQYAPPFR